MVVKTWKECKDLTDGFPGKVFKGFMNEKEAWAWLNDEPLNSEVQKDILDVVYIYSDGACSGNPGPGGWGTVVKFNGQSNELSGYEKETTNNRMELKAFLSGLEFALQNYGKEKKIVATLDSQYVLNGAKKWMLSWAENGWKKADGKEIINLDIWKEVYKLTKNINIEYVWIKGHNGHPENEKCDKLAVYAYQSHEDEDYSEQENDNEVFTNLSLIRSVNKETLVRILCSSRFSNILFTEGPTRLLEVLDMPAQDWGVDVVKKMLKNEKT